MHYYFTCGSDEERSNVCQRELISSSTPVGVGKFLRLDCGRSPFDRKSSRVCLALRRETENSKMQLVTTRLCRCERDGQQLATCNGSEIVAGMRQLILKELAIFWAFIFLYTISKLTSMNDINIFLCFSVSPIFLKNFIREILIKEFVELFISESRFSRSLLEYMIDCSKFSTLTINRVSRADRL